jgi:hypothetical protein
MEQKHGAWGGAVAGLLLFLIAFYFVPQQAVGQAATADPGAGSFRDQLVNNEKALAEAQTQKKAAALQEMLDPNLIFVAFNGMVFTRQQLVAKVQYIDVSQYDMENFKVRRLGPNACLLTYDLRVKASVAGHNLPDKEYASSLWLRHGRGWQLVFHQETPAHHS